MSEWALSWAYIAEFLASLLGYTQSKGEQTCPIFHHCSVITAHTRKQDVWHFVSASSSFTEESFSDQVDP